MPNEPKQPVERFDTRFDCYFTAHMAAQITRAASREGERPTTWIRRVLRQYLQTCSDQGRGDC